MKNLLMSAAALLLIVGLINANGPGNLKTVYQADKESSSVTWTGKKVTAEHTGTIGLKDASIIMDGDKYVSANIIFDMNAITNTDLNEEYGGKLIGHLKSDDFFSVAKFPTAQFRASEFTALRAPDENGNNYVVTGSLTIKGKTNEISFPVSIKNAKETLKITGTAVFDRSKWDIRYGSGSFFDDLGDKVIYDDVELSFSITASQLTTRK